MGTIEVRVPLEVVLDGSFGRGLLVEGAGRFNTDPVCGPGFPQ